MIPRDRVFGPGGSQLIFPVVSPAGPHAVRTRLSEEFELRERPSESVQRTYYDTFDWRLFAAGEILTTDRAAHSLRLAWSSMDGNDCYASLSLHKEPRFAIDLPVGAIRERLEERIAQRALLPLATVIVTTRTVLVVDTEGKTLLRILLEDYCLGNSDKPTRHVRQLRLIGLKGYSVPFSRVRALVEESLGAAPIDDSVYLQALAINGKQPGSYSSKLTLCLNPESRADAAVKHICTQLLMALQTNEAGVRGDVDAECLHDYRVAIRRTRSALGQMKGVFPVSTVERYRREFAWLGQITGPPRDLDVYLLNFDAYQASLPVSLRKALEPLRVLLRQHKRQAHQALVIAMDSARYKRLLSGWGRFLCTNPPRRSRLPSAARPIILVASHRLWRLYRRICQQGAAIQPDTAPEALHILRKSCKKLRYLLEFFRSLFPEGELQDSIKALKHLQDILGDFQDAAIQSKALERYAREMDRGDLARETLLAMGTLIGNLVARQERARAHFAESFQLFTGPKNFERFHGLFRVKALSRDEQCSPPGSFTRDYPCNLQHQRRCR